MDIFDKYIKIAKFTDNLYKKIFVISFLIILVLIVIYIIFPVNNQNPLVLKTDNNISEDSRGRVLQCLQSLDSQLENVVEGTIQVVKDIAIVNVNSEVEFGDLKKNVIPPVNRPQFAEINSLQNCLPGSKEVIVIELNGYVKAYPIDILEYHLVVNDFVGDTPVSVMYSPISGIYKAYNTRIKQEIFRFGHSGALYKNTDLFYDFQSQSLWNVQNGKAVVGMMSGAQLQEVSIRLMSYKRAQELFPNAQILTFKTSFRRYYGVDPFYDYKINNEVYQAPTNFYTGANGKESALVFTIGDQQYAILEKTVKEKSIYRTEINGQKFKIVYADGEFLAYLGLGSDSEIKLYSGYLFVWYDYNPIIKILN